MALARNKTTNVPTSTIRRYQNKAINKLAHICRKSYLSSDEEKELAEYMRYYNFFFNKLIAYFDKIIFQKIYTSKIVILFFVFPDTWMRFICLSMLRMHAKALFEKGQHEEPTPDFGYKW